MGLAPRHTPARFDPLTDTVSAHKARLAQYFAIVPRAIKLASSFLLHQFWLILPASIF